MELLLKKAIKTVIKNFETPAAAVAVEARIEQGDWTLLCVGQATEHCNRWRIIRHDHSLRPNTAAKNLKILYNFAIKSQFLWQLAGRIIDKGPKIIDR